MKIRNGFVSNSSSSSFYITRTENPISFEKLSEYYELSPDLTEEERVWMTICIWMALRDVEGSEISVKESGEDDYTYNDSARLNEYFSDENVSWMKNNSYYMERLPDDFWEKAKKLRDNPYGVVGFSIDSVEGLELPIGYTDNLDLPFDFKYGIRYKEDKVFVNPEKGICLI